MKFLVVVCATLNKPFDHWAERFDREEAARTEAGVETVFRAPVVGTQAVMFGMKTATPRLVHDMMYHPAIRPGIEESGLVVGSEQITVCEDGA